MTTIPPTIAHDAAWAAFRKGDWYERFLPAALVLGLSIPSMFWGHLELKTALFALAALSLAVATAYLDQGTRRLALPAVIAGTCPLVCGLAAAQGGHICVGGVCSSWCVPACLGSAALAGGLLGRLWARRTAHPTAVAVTGLLGWSVGALGCSCASHSGIWAMSVGLIGGVVVGGLWGRVRHS
jgi:hypothetical protein